MSQETLNVMLALNSIRDVTKQVAQLLLTCDGLLAEEHWERRHNNCLSIKAGIDNPVEWIPGYYFRTYRNKRFPKITAYITVILGAPESGVENLIKEPLITACWCYWGNAKEPSKELLSGWAYAHIWCKDRKDNGAILVTDVKENWPSDYKYGVSKFFSLGVPLDGITSTVDLKSKIIDPFCKGVEQHSSK